MTSQPVMTSSHCPGGYFRFLFGGVTAHSTPWLVCRGSRYLCRTRGHLLASLSWMETGIRELPQYAITYPHVHSKLPSFHDRKPRLNPESIAFRTAKCGFHKMQELEEMAASVWPLPASARRAKFGMAS
jgi:hypothetical protein